jgi:hypothetical protein
MLLKDKIKDIADKFNYKKKVLFISKWQDNADVEYKEILSRIDEAAKNGNYFIDYEPDIPYEAYNLIQNKLEKDGFKSDYIGGGYIAIWWDDSDGKQYTTHFN